MDPFKFSNKKDAVVENIFTQPLFNDYYPTKNNSDFNSLDITSLNDYYKIFSSSIINNKYLPSYHSYIYDNVEIKNGT